MARHQYTNSPPPLGVDQSRLSQVYSNAPGSSAEETIDRLALQILQQGTSDRWTGQGGGDRYTNARWMAGELYSKGGITRLEDFGSGYVDTPVETEAVQRYNPETGGYSYYISEYDPANGYSYTEIDPSKVKGEFREKYVEYGEGGGYVPAFYVQTTRKDPAFFNKATGQLVSKDFGDSNVWGGTYSGDGMTQYGVQFNELGMPIFYTQYQDNSDWGAISAIVSIASFIPGVAPFAQALNAAMQAYSGNTTGAILSALGSAYSFGQQYSSLGSDAIEYVKKAAEAGETSSNLSKVADFFYENAGKIKTAQQAGQLFSALNNQDLAGIIGGLQGLAPQIGVTVPESAVKAIQVAAVSQAVSRGDVTGALLAAGTLTNNSDLTLAGKGAAIIKAAETGNPIAMLSAAIDFGKTTKTMAPKDVQSALKKAGLPVSETMAADLMSKDPESVAGILDAQFKAAKDAREIYKQQSGSELPDSFFESNQDLTPAALKEAADKLYTTQEEAKKIWAEQTGGAPASEFDLSQLEGLSDSDANSIAGEQGKNFKDLRNALGRDLTSSDIDAIKGKPQDQVDAYINNLANVDEDEARQFFKDVYGSNYEPTKEEVLSVMGVSDAASKNLVAQGYKQKLESAMDGSKYESKEEAARAAAENPDSQLFKWDGKIYNASGLRSAIQDAKLNDEVRKMSMFDATGYKTPEEARVAAEKAGFNSFYMKDGSEYSVTTPPIKDMLALADSMAADRGESFNDVFAAYRKALGPGQTFEWQGKTYTTDFADPNVFDASKASDKNAAAALAYANGKDTFVAPDGKTYRIPEEAKQSLSNYLNQSPAETARLLGQNAVLEEVSAAKTKAPSLTADSMSFLEAAGTYLGATTKDLLIGMPNKGFGEALKFLSDTAVAAHMYKDPETGKVHFAIPRDNPLYKAGEYFSNIGDANTSAFVRQWRNEVISATEKETDPTSKLLTAAWMAAKNPVQGLLWGVEEGFNDLPALVVGGTGGILLRNSAAAGIPMTATLSNVAEVAGPAAMDTFDKGIKAGLEPAEAYDRAMKTMIGSAALSLVVSKHADEMLYKDLVSNTIKDSVGKMWGKNVAAQTLEEYADEYSTASWKGWVDAGEPTNPSSLIKIHNDATTQAAIASMVARSNVNASFMGEVIGNSVTGKVVTLADLLSDNPPALDASTIRSNAVIGKTDGGSDITLAQKLAETSFKDGPVSFFSSEAPEFVRDAAAPYLSLDNPNISISDYFQAANIFSENGYTDASPQEVADLATSSKGMDSDDVRALVDSQYTTEEEARQLFKDVGINNPTQDQINQFVGKKSESDVTQQIKALSPFSPAPEGDPGSMPVENIGGDTGGDYGPGISDVVTPDTGNTTGGGTTTETGSGGTTGGTTDTSGSTGATTGGATETQTGGSTATGTTGGEQTQTQGVTTEQVNQLISQALANNPGVTQAQVQQIVNDAISTLPTGASLEAVQGIVNAAIAGIPAGITTDDVKSIVDEAIANNPGLSQEDVSNIVNDAIANNPGITVDDVKTVVNDAISGITPGVTTDQVQQIVNDAIASNPSLTAGQVQQIVNDAISANPSITLDQVQSVVADAISGIQPGVTQDQVQQIVNDAIASNPGVTEDQVRQIVNDAVAGVPAGTTTEQIQQIVNDAISGIPSGVTQDDVQSIINDALAKNPGITEEQVRQIVGDAVSSLPAGTSLGQIQQIVDNAVAGIQPGTTEEQVREIVGEATGNVSTELKAKYDALSAEQKALADALVQQGSDLGTAIDDAVSSIKSDVQSKYDALSAEQKALADALVNQGADLNTAIETVASNLQSQMQEQYNSLSESQKALADALIQQGVDTSTAIQQAVTQLQTEAQTRHDALTEQQQAMADALVQQGVDLNTAINTVASQIQTQIQEQYNALTEQQKALADAMTQQGVDLQTAIDVASTQTQQQITQLGTSLDTRINELVQQGQTYQQATTNAINELTTQNQNLQGLIGTQGRDVTQGDIDLLTGMVSGTTPIDLSYDVNGDKQITQADIDWLTGVTSGTNVDWQPPQGSAWAPTGLYGQIFDIERQRRADADAARRSADQAAADAAARDAANRAEAQRQATISRVGAANLAANQQAQQLAQQVQQYQKASQETTTPIYAGEIQDFDLGAPLDFGFLKPSKEKQAGQSGGQTTKIASGGYLDDLLDLLK